MKGLGKFLIAIGVVAMAFSVIMLAITISNEDNSNVDFFPRIWSLIIFCVSALSILFGVIFRSIGRGSEQKKQAQIQAEQDKLRQQELQTQQQILQELQKQNGSGNGTNPPA
jgi:membrane protein insertase Oxa1/YidC/SpoIIIJ